MTTEKQIIANQQNAQLGGVKSDEGKTISRMNALKHGILCNMVMPEEKEEAETIYKSLEEQYAPQTPLEEIIIERITIWIIRLRRAVKTEKDQWLNLYNPRIIRTESSFPKLDLMIKEVVVSEGYSLKVLSSDIKTLDETFLRYENSLERNLFRAIHELQRLIAIRNGQPTPLPLTMDVTVDKFSAEKEE